MVVAVAGWEVVGRAVVVVAVVAVGRALVAVVVGLVVVAVAAVDYGPYGPGSRQLRRTLTFRRVLGGRAVEVAVAVDEDAAMWWWRWRCGRKWRWKTRWRVDDSSEELLELMVMGESASGVGPVVGAVVGLTGWWW